MASDGRGFLRRTRQREVILSVLRSTDTHPTADWVYQEVREVLPHVSLGTIYRNLRILVESGEALELGFGSTASRFDGNPENHYHFVCLDCGSVYDLPVPVHHDLDQEIAEATNHRVDYHRLEFYGVCQHCRKRADSPRRGN